MLSIKASENKRQRDCLNKEILNCIFYDVTSFVSRSTRPTYATHAAGCDYTGRLKKIALQVFWPLLGRFLVLGAKNPKQRFLRHPVELYKIPRQKLENLLCGPTGKSSRRFLAVFLVLGAEKPSRAFFLRHPTDILHLKHPRQR